jgi:hypothetical protein
MKNLYVNTFTHELQNQKKKIIKKTKKKTTIYSNTLWDPHEQDLCGAM